MNTRRSIGSCLSLLALVSLACSRDPARAARAALTEGEVVAFMQSYEADLRARNREAIIARYDSAGALMLGNGHKAFVAFNSLAASYRTAWAGPDFVAFQNMSYLPVGDSAMVVAGQFRWLQPGTRDTMLFSYVSLVRSTAGGLRIVLEDESFAPPTR